MSYCIILIIIMIITIIIITIKDDGNVQEKKERKKPNHNSRESWNETFVGQCKQDKQLKWIMRKQVNNTIA